MKNFYQYLSIIFTLFLFISFTPVDRIKKMKPYDETIKGTKVTFKMVPIKGGEFLLGSPDQEANRDTDEGPQKKVTIEPFWMMEKEATWDLFDLYIDQEKRRQVEYAQENGMVQVDAMTMPSTPYLDPSFGMGKENFPAVSMTQFSVITFCKWLYLATGNFYRLPTEAEWEYACRAGTTSTYYFGDDPSQLGDYAWYWDNSDEKYHECGRKKPNEWGLYDMLGNVAEWTLDQYQEDYYSTIEDEQVNPWRTPTDLHPRTVKGGSWYDEAKDLRCAGRLESKRAWQKRDPQIPKSFWWNTDAPFLGFRLVRPAKKMTPEEIEEFFDTVLGG